MFLREITEEKIIFDNGTEISFVHDTECCEKVYADFKQLKDSPFGILNSDFENDVKIEVVKNAGFRFGDDSNSWWFVPCYDVQNGYYSDDLTLIITFPDKTTKEIDLKEGLQHFLG